MFKLYINSIEMDAANAIQLLNSDTQQDHHHLRNQIVACRSLIQELGNPPIKKIMKESKKYTDLLSRDAKSHLFPYPVRRDVTSSPQRTSHSIWDQNYLPTSIWLFNLFPFIGVLLPFQLTNVCVWF